MNASGGETRAPPFDVRLSEIRSAANPNTLTSLPPYLVSKAATFFPLMRASGRPASKSWTAFVGLSASGCVLGTYWRAFDGDVRPYLIRGGVASHNEEHVRFAEEICDTVSLDALDSTFC